MHEWTVFNALLQETTSERKLLGMLRKELNSQAPRPPYIDRIYGRFSRLRSERERAALLEHGRVPRG